MTQARTLSLFIFCLLFLSSTFSAQAVQSSVLSNQDQKIIAYFSPSSEGKSQTLKHAAEHGYYRVLIKKDSKGYLIQDFYQDTRTKQTNPVYIKDDMDLTQSGPQSLLGKLILYFPNGKIHSVGQYDAKHQLTHYRHYDLNGHLISTLEIFNKISYQNYWYPNQHIALKLKLMNDVEILSAKAWTADGWRIPNKKCFQLKRLDLDPSSDQCLLLLLKFEQEGAKLFDQMHLLND